ncbi:hypothetical protein [Burkholderia sp. Ax-1719]|uniref:hypothetical protein n=1 Tax=Burkholderia sp. Ax-1719 TaxID=2608334 RepID=UPI001420C141|nr:hypothetical protein [Burkholderia sp. Ax-1719]NIE64470.1 hypothetical protein [Burkholderia sp. Ax-1719]
MKQHSPPRIEWPHALADMPPERPEIGPNERYLGRPLPDAVGSSRPTAALRDLQGVKLVSLAHGRQRNMAAYFL